MEIIEGRNPVLEALRAGRPLEKILMARQIRRQGAVTAIMSLARERGVPIELVDGMIIAGRATTANPQGVLAIAASQAYTSLDDILAKAKAGGRAAFIVVLDGIEDPQNLGAILRTAEAAGVDGVIVRSRRAAGLTGAVARASAGAVEYIPVARVANIVQTLDILKRDNIWTVGIDMAGERLYTDIDFRPPTALVIGGEGKGISALVKKRCDFLARIPMRGRIGSLNASAAAAVAMYEVLRQRGD